MVYFSYVVIEDKQKMAYNFSVVRCKAILFAEENS